MTGLCNYAYNMVGSDDRGVYDASAMYSGSILDFLSCVQN